MGDCKQVVELNIISIVIGVLFARIIWLWMEESSLYVQSMVEIDPDDSLKDSEDAIDAIPGTLAATSITMLIIVLLIAGYLK